MLILLKLRKLNLAIMMCVFVRQNFTWKKLNDIIFTIKFNICISKFRSVETHLNFIAFPNKGFATELVSFCATFKKHYYALWVESYPYINLSILYISKQTRLFVLKEQSV